MYISLYPISFWMYKKSNLKQWNKLERTERMGHRIRNGILVKTCELAF